MAQQHWQTTHFTLHVWLCLLLMVRICASILPPIPQCLLLPVEPCLFNPLSFTLAYHILHTYGLSIIVKVCAHAACSPPGRVHVPLLDLLLCAGRNGLHLILCTLDTVTAYIPVTLFFPLGVWLCSINKGLKINPEMIWE